MLQPPSRADDRCSMATALAAAADTPTAAAALTREETSNGR